MAKKQIIYSHIVISELEVQQQQPKWLLNLDKFLNSLVSYHFCLRPKERNS